MSDGYLEKLIESVGKDFKGNESYTIKFIKLVTGENIISTIVFDEESIESKIMYLLRPLRLIENESEVEDELGNKSLLFLKPWISITDDDLIVINHSSILCITDVSEAYMNFYIQVVEKIETKKNDQEENVFN